MFAVFELHVDRFVGEHRLDEGLGGEIVRHGVDDLVERWCAVGRRFDDGPQAARRHHDGHRAGGGREVDVLVGLAQRGHLGHHVDGCDARPLERLQQAIAAVHELLDLLARHLATAGQFAQHPLAVGAGLVDHLAALLLGHRQLGFGIGRRVVAAAGGLDLGLLAAALRLVGGLAKEAPGVVLGAHLDLRCGLAGGGQDARGFLAQQAGDHFLVERHRRVGRGALRGAQLAFEELLTLLQARQLGGHHAQEIADFCLIEAPARRREVGRRHRRGRRGVGT